MANLIPHVETRTQGLEIRNAPTARPRRSLEGFVGLLPRWRLYRPLRLVSRANHRNRPGEPQDAIPLQRASSAEWLLFKIRG